MPLFEQYVHDYAQSALASSRTHAEFSISQRMQFLAMYLLAPCLTSSAQACIHWPMAPLKLQQKPYDLGCKLQRRIITRDAKQVCAGTDSFNLLTGLAAALSHDQKV